MGTIDLGYDNRQIKKLFTSSEYLYNVKIAIIYNTTLNSKRKSRTLVVDPERSLDMSPPVAKVVRSLRPVRVHVLRAQLRESLVVTVAVVGQNLFSSSDGTSSDQ